LSASARAETATGPCASIDLLDPSDPNGVRFIGCDGAQTEYKLAISSQDAATVIDLSPAVSTPQIIAANIGTAFLLTREGGALAINAETVSISSVVNAASLAPGLSPGGLFTLFGSGLNNGGVNP
jgi:hypothetical protein